MKNTTNSTIGSKLNEVRELTDEELNELFADDPYTDGIVWIEHQVSLMDDYKDLVIESTQYIVNQLGEYFEVCDEVQDFTD